MMVNTQDVQTPRTTHELEASFMGRFESALMEYAALSTDSSVALTADRRKGGACDRCSRSDGGGDEGGGDEGGDDCSGESGGESGAESGGEFSASALHIFAQLGHQATREQRPYPWDRIGAATPRACGCVTTAAHPAAHTSAARPCGRRGGSSASNGLVTLDSAPPLGKEKTKEGKENASMIARPASIVRRDATRREGAHSFGSVARFSPSGTMAHHRPTALPLAAARPATATRPATAPRSQGAGRQDEGASPRQTAAVTSEDPTTLTDSHVPRPFGGSAVGVLRFEYRRTAPRARVQRRPVPLGVAGLHGVVAQGGDAQGSAVCEAMGLDGVVGLAVLECCGEAFEGYCCKRHHPDDSVVCCKRHQTLQIPNQVPPSQPIAPTRKSSNGVSAGSSPAASSTPPSAWPSRTAGPTYSLPRAGRRGAFRETAIACVPKGNVQGAREPNRDFDGRPETACCRWS